MKFIPLANLKNTTGIVMLCKEANEMVVANRNGEPKLVLMSRTVYEKGFGKVMENAYINVKRDLELVAEPVLIRTFNNPAEIVRICESVKGKIVPVLRNGVDELYVMDYEAFREMKVTAFFYDFLTVRTSNGHQKRLATRQKPCKQAIFSIK